VTPNAHRRRGAVIFDVALTARPTRRKRTHQNLTVLRLWRGSSNSAIYRSKSMVALTFLHACKRRLNVRRVGLPALPAYFHHHVTRRVAARASDRTPALRIIHVHDSLSVNHDAGAFARSDAAQPTTHLLANTGSRMPEPGLPSTMASAWLIQHYRLRAHLPRFELWCDRIHYLRLPQRQYRLFTWPVVYRDGLFTYCSPVVAVFHCPYDRHPRPQRRCAGACCTYGLTPAPRVTICSFERLVENRRAGSRDTCSDGTALYSLWTPPLPGATSDDAAPSGRPANNIIPL